MESIALAVPVLAGKKEDLLEMHKVLNKEKWNEFVESEKRTGAEKERQFLQSTPIGDMIIIYIESKDVKQTLERFGTSKDPFDVWLKGEIEKVTGVDFNRPSGPLPELILTYDK